MRGCLNHWRDATAALGRMYECHVTLKNGKSSKRKVFLSVGTGVIVGLQGRSQHTPWLLTAKHVLFEPSEHWDPSSLILRFSWMDEMPVDQPPGITIALKVAGKRKWIPHPDKHVDLACMPLPPRKNLFGRKTWPMVTVPEIGTTKDIYEGEPIVALGYPDTLAPDFGARPIVRQGIVSWVSSKKPESSLFCIDSQVFPGNSGGPVFRWSDNVNRPKRSREKPEVCFLGIVTQARIHQLHLLADLDAYEGDKRVHCQSWDQTIPRDFI